MATIIDPPNSVWPNGLKVDSEGYVTFYPLGTNKVDINAITWPDGDKLISPFVYQNDKLVGFVDTKALTISGSATTTMNYNHIEADFSSIVEGKLTVNAPNAVVKEFRWSVVDNGDDNVIATIKYKGCKTDEDVIAVDPDYLTNDIIDGVWSEGLGDLTNGFYMFYNCTNLTTFSSDLSNLAIGEYMFWRCSALTSFSSDLPSLTYGVYMFTDCKLDAQSVANIVHTLPQRNTKPTNLVDYGSIWIGIGCDNTEADQLLFAQECGCETWQELLDEFDAKNWGVFFQCNNGRPATTYNMRRGETLPVYIKLEEVTDEKHAQYTSADGSKFFNIHYFHSTNGSTEGYTQFNSLEEAIEHFNIKPIERN